VASIDDNRELWGRPERWSLDGDEWSEGWGGPESQWSSWIAPRLRAAVGEPPLGRIVEIGCGHGRWTQFLAGWSSDVIALDVTPACVAACEERFAAVPSVQARRCDGRSLPDVEDRSVDLVFSFDSLVHADAEAMGGYVAEIGRVLTDDGVAWIHHSNLHAAALDRSALLRRVGPLHRLLARARVVEPEVHWRDPSVDADLVRRLAGRHGLVCASQELLRWTTRRTYIDCVSELVRSGSSAPAAATPKGRWENEGFEAQRAAAFAAAERRSGRPG
jgi:SAM-dependent methyltransferase